MATTHAVNLSGLLGPGRLNGARVRLEPAPPVGDDEPELTVPFVLDDERLGVVEGGPAADGRGQRLARALRHRVPALVDDHQFAAGPAPVQLPGTCSGELASSRPCTNTPGPRSAGRPHSGSREAISPGVCPAISPRWSIHPCASPLRMRHDADGVTPSLGDRSGHGLLHAACCSFARCRGRSWAPARTVPPPGPRALEPLHHRTEASKATSSTRLARRSAGDAHYLDPARRGPSLLP